MNVRETLRRRNHKSENPRPWEWTLAILSCVLVGLFWQTGCAGVSTTMPTVPSIPIVTRGDVDPLSDQVNHLRHSVDIMERISRQNQQERERSLEQLRTLVQRSTGALLERQHRLRSGLGTPPDQSKQRSDQKPPASPPSRPQTDRYEAMHRSAYTSYQRGEFQIAYQRFMQIYREAPSAAQKGQALFWAGYCAYDMKDWDRAIATFDAFRKEYPADPLVRSALLRTAAAHSQKGDDQKARRMFETLIKQFPNSEEAELARQRLADVSGS